jgi:hypothetical protein
VEDFHLLTDELFDRADEQCGLVGIARIDKTFGDARMPGNFID